MIFAITFSAPESNITLAEESDVDCLLLEIANDSHFIDATWPSIPLNAYELEWRVLEIFIMYELEHGSSELLASSEAPEAGSSEVRVESCMSDTMENLEPMELDHGME